MLSCLYTILLLPILTLYRSLELEGTNPVFTGPLELPPKYEEGTFPYLIPAAFLLLSATLG